jgi:hypothetical protein
MANGHSYSLHGNVLGGSWVDTDVNTPGNGWNGLHMVNASSPGNVSTVQNNVIVANGRDGIRVSDDTSAAIFQGNIIGLRPPLFSPGAFRPLSGNSLAGIRVQGSAGADNQIGFFSGNTIANNDGPGILIQADSQSIRGNLVGVPNNGEVAPGFERSDYGNDSMVNGFAVRIQSDGNTVGSSGSGRNTIGQSNSGVSIGGSDNVVAWNWVGVDSEGNEVSNTTGISTSVGQVGNQIHNNTIVSNHNGIITSSQSFITRNTILESSFGIRARGATQIGSIDATDANVIGNSTIGIWVGSYASDPPSALVAIRNNLIGTNAEVDDLGNGVGIEVLDADNRVWIGQSDGTGNVIGFSSGPAIDLRDGASDVLVAGNRIGVHLDGQPIPNGGAVRMWRGDDVKNNQIGYAHDSQIDAGAWSPGNDAGNVIAFNNFGVDFVTAGADTNGNTIRGNRFAWNDPEAGLGSDLGMDSVDIGGNEDGPIRC